MNPPPAASRRSPGRPKSPSSTDSSGGLRPRFGGTPAGRREGQILYRAIQALLVLLAISRYDATSFLFRGEETIDFFNWFWRRRWFGMFSFFDFLLGGLFVLAILTRKTRSSRPGFDAFVPLLAALVGVSILVRYSTQGPFDTRQDFLFQFRNYLYLALSYFIARRLNWSEARVRSTMKLLLGLAVLVVALYYVETFSLTEGMRVSKYGRVANVRDVADFGFILFAQFWLVAIAIEQFPARWAQRIGLMALIAYSLYSTFTGIGKSLLVIYPVYLAYFFFHYRLYRRPIVVGVVGLGFLGVAALVGYLAVANPEIEESSPLYIYTTFTSQDPSVSTRRSELANFFPNLVRRGAWLQGIGLGTKWYEYYEQPVDFGAFPEHERGLPWHLGVHVPLLRLGYDFGLFGLALLLGLFGTRFFRSLRFLRRTPVRPVTRAFVQASLLAVGYELFVNNLGLPKANLVVGVLLASLQGLIETTPRVRLVGRRTATAPRATAHAHRD